MRLADANFNLYIWHYLQLSTSVYVFELHLPTFTALQSVISHPLFCFLVQWILAVMSIGCFHAYMCITLTVNLIIALYSFVILS